MYKCIDDGEKLLCPGLRESLVKSSGLSFYRFPADPVRRAQWVAAVNRKSWDPTEYSWLCNAHLISGVKVTNYFYYMPSIFSHTKSPRKCKSKRDLHAYTRRKEDQRRSEALNREVSQSLHVLTLAEGNTEMLNEDNAMKDATTMTIVRWC